MDRAYICIYQKKKYLNGFLVKECRKAATWNREATKQTDIKAYIRKGLGSGGPVSSALGSGRIASFL